MPVMWHSHLCTSTYARTNSERAHAQRPRRRALVRLGIYTLARRAPDGDPQLFLASVAIVPSFDDVADARDASSPFVVFDRRKLRRHVGRGIYQLAPAQPR